MAPPLTVVVGDKGSREWKPAEYEDEATYSHLVEIAKTGRARCRRCVRARLPNTSETDRSRFVFYIARSHRRS